MKGSEKMQTKETNRVESFLGLFIVISIVGTALRFIEIEALNEWNQTINDLTIYAYYGVVLFGLIPFFWRRKYTFFQWIARNASHLVKETATASFKGVRKITEKSQTEAAFSLDITEKIKRIQSESSREQNKFTEGSQSLDYPLQSGLPPLAYLPVTNEGGKEQKTDSKLMVAESNLLSDALIDLNIIKMEDSIEVINIIYGPNVRRVTFQLPKGLKLSQIQRAQDDIANRLGVLEGLQIQSGSLPGTAAILIPNERRYPVYLSTLLSSREFLNVLDKSPLPIILGINDHNEPVFTDLTKIRHLLIAGSTGSGKSVFLNSMLITWLYTKTPEELKLILIDPKLVELRQYVGFPHVERVETNMKKAIQVLMQLIEEVKRRYEVLAHRGVKNIAQYHRMRKENDELMPYIVCVMDELSELMLIAGDAVEDCVLSLAQIARAAGVHLVIATQRPSIDVITGTIKANLPSRISFRLQSSADYVTIFGTGGNCTLLGQGDGLAMIEGFFNKIRFQSPTISIMEEEEEETVEKLKNFWKNRYSGSRMEPQMNVEENMVEDEFTIEELQDSFDEVEKEPQDLVAKTRDYILENPVFTVSDLQKYLSVRRQKVSEILYVLVEEGLLVPPPEGNPRKGFTLRQDSQEKEVITETEDNE